MVRFNHFSIVEKSFEEKLAELKSLGFSFAGLSEKEIVSAWLRQAPIGEKKLQATPSKDLEAFLSSGEPLDWEIFYSLSLQLLAFAANFDFEAGQAIDFAKSINLPMVEGELTSESLISAIYLLLCSRTKLGMLLVEAWVSEGLLEPDDAFHFFNDKSLATFDTRSLKREVVYVESPVDTLGRGTYDLVRVQIIRPAYEGKLPVVMTASPYHMGTNPSANDKKLHEMKGDLFEKEAHEISVENRLPQLPIYEKTKTPLAAEATEHFVHGWSSSLNDYLLARGFASVYVAGVGTRDSDGMQTSGDYQQIYSMKAVIDWLNGRARAFVDRERSAEIEATWAFGNVAMTGKSYLGTMAYGTATTGVEGLKVILAESGISSWYGYYRENGLVRSPGGFPGEDLDVLAELTYSRNLDGADYLAGNAVYQQKLAELTADLDRETGDYNQFWADRNYLPQVNKVACDVLIEHGLQDWNVTPDQAYHFWQALPATVTKHAFLHRGAHIYSNSWQSFDYAEVVNAYFTAKLLEKPLNLQLPALAVQENGVYQGWLTLDKWGSAAKTELQLGEGQAQFENAYAPATFAKYSQKFEDFKKDLFDGKANAPCLDLNVPEAMTINGPIKVQVRLKLNGSKGLLSAQLLDFGEKKRLPDAARLVEPKVLDRARNFQMDDLVEIPLVDSPYQLISKGFLNLQNRDGLLTISEIPENQWFTAVLELQPAIYKLSKNDKLRLLLYSTDFEHTIRDNRELIYDIDLSQSKLIFPVE